SSYRQHCFNVGRIRLQGLFAELDNLGLIVLLLIYLHKLQVGFSYGLGLGKLFLKVQKQRYFSIRTIFRVDLLKSLILGTSRNNLRVGIRDQPPDKDNTQRQNDFCLHLVLLFKTPLSGLAATLSKLARGAASFLLSSSFSGN